MKTISNVVKGVMGMLACVAATSMACEQPAAPVAPPAPAVQVPPPGQPPAAPAPQPGDKKDDKVPTCLGPDGKEHPFPLDVYDENADPVKTIRDAIAKGKKENKRVLVMWGENWCQFCLFLDDILKNDPGCAPIVESDYVWVRVDLGKGFSKNQQLAESYWITEWTPRPNGKMMGAPSLCVIDAETGQTWGVFDPATGLHTGVLGGNDMVAVPMALSRLFDEKIIKSFLINCRAPARPAAGAMNQAIMVAKRDGRKVLALFVMPGDDACKRFANWIERPDAAAALGNTFSVVKIDTERMIGGTEMLLMANDKATLPPLLVVLDEKGKAIGGPESRFSMLPKTDTEIDAFIKGLSTAAKIGDADKQVLIRSLKDAAMVAAEPKKP